MSRLCWQKTILSEFTIHNLKVLAVKMYKIYQRKSPKIMNDLVEEFDTKYHTRSHYGVELDKGGNGKSLNPKLCSGIFLKQTPLGS